eukprot:g6924.t1
MRRSAAWAMYSLVSNDRNVFDDAFVRAYPDCEIQTQKRASRRLGAGQPRYALCSITSNGEYNISSNCSITQTIIVNAGDVLRIHGVVGADGQRPAIDGGWDEVRGSKTGVGLFLVKEKATLIIHNVNVLAIGQGATERSISAVVAEIDADTAMEVVNDFCCRM